MKPSPRLLLTLAIVLLAVCGTSCARSRGNGGQKQMTQAEVLRIEKAVNEFHARMNVGEYGQIWEGRFSNAVGSREAFSKHLDWIHQKYGPVTQNRLVKGEVRSHIDQPRKQVADCVFEIRAEKGRYMERIIWHFLDGEERLAAYELAQYDEQGRLYINMALHTGLGPNDVETHKIILGNGEQSTR